MSYEKTCYINYFILILNFRTNELSNKLGSPMPGGQVAKYESVDHSTHF